LNYLSLYAIIVPTGNILQFEVTMNNINMQASFWKMSPEGGLWLNLI